MDQGVEAVRRLDRLSRHPACQLHLEVAAERGALFPCPTCGKPCKAHDFADAAEAKVHGFTRNAVGTAASKVGLTPQFFSSAQETLETVKSSNAVMIPPLMAAFAAGVALASRIQSMRHRDDDYDHGDRYYDDRYDYDEDDDY